MAAGLHADALLDALALPLPAGRPSRTPSWCEENAARDRHEPEYELLDTGVLDDGAVLRRRGDLRQGRRRRTCASGSLHQPRAGGGDPAPAADAVVPQHLVLGARRTATRRCGAADERGRSSASTATLGDRWLTCERRPRRCCSPRTRPTPSGCTARPSRTAVRQGRHQRPRRRAGCRRSTRARHRDQGRRLVLLDMRAGRDGDLVRLRLSGRAPAPQRARPRASTRSCAPAARRGRRVLRRGRCRPVPRRRTGRGAPPGDGRPAVDQAVLRLRRRAVAGRRPGLPAAARAAPARCATREWRHLGNADVISMPDDWEYPWYAAWDLAFHMVPLALVDPEFAKEQLVLLCREWYMHPNGQLPAYEWAFGDVNPPVHAWAACGSTRSTPSATGAATASSSSGSSTSCCSTSPGGSTARTPTGATCSPAASSAWTTSGCSTAPRRCPAAPGWSRPTARAGWRCTALNMLAIALELAARRPGVRGRRDQVLRALPGHRRRARPPVGACGTSEDGFFYDVLHVATGSRRCRCGCARWSGSIPLFAGRDHRAGAAGPRCPDFTAADALVLARTEPELCRQRVHAGRAGRPTGCMLSVLRPRPAAARPARTCSDEEEFLSPVRRPLAVRPTATSP